MLVSLAFTVNIPAAVITAIGHVTYTRLTQLLEPLHAFAHQESRITRPNRTFPKGRFDVVTIAGVAVGRATYEPGWIWSVHVGSGIGQTSCPVRHVGVVLEGCAKVRMDDGTELELRAGDVFEIDPGHDSWVVGDTPYVSLHLEGAEAYAR